MTVTGSANSLISITGGGNAFDGFQLAASNTFSVAGPGNLTVSMPLADRDNGQGAASLTKTGTGLLVFNAANSFSGGLTVSAGTVQLGSGVATLGAATAAVAVNAPGVLDLNGNNVSMGGLNGSGLVTDVAGSGADTVTLGNTAGGNYTFTGGIANGSGTVSVVMAAGSGFQRLSGLDTYTGPTSINGGVLSMNGAGAIPPASSIVFAGGALRWSFVNTDVSGQIAPINNPGAHLFYINNQNVTFANSLSGSGGITLATFVGSQGTDSPGILTLNAANPGLTGPTTVNGGTLAIADPAGNALQSSAVSVNYGGSLELSVSAGSIGSLAGAVGGSVNLNSGTLTTGGNNASTTYRGVISGAGGLIKTGTGTMALSQVSSYSGPTVISGGVLQSSLWGQNSALPGRNSSTLSPRAPRSIPATTPAR